MPPKFDAEKRRTPEKKPGKVANTILASLEQGGLGALRSAAKKLGYADTEALMEYMDTKLPDETNPPAVYPYVVYRFLMKYVKGFTREKYGALLSQGGQQKG